jgi:uncharacterized protein
VALTRVLLSSRSERRRTGRTLSSYLASRYNFAFRGDRGGVALFNAFTGAVIKLDGRHVDALANSLSDHRLLFSGSEFSDELRESLRRGGFLVQAHFDELHAVRERYWRARGETPVVLTITTTMDCNLGCYYCYEERSGKALKSTDVSATVDLARDLVARSGRHSLHVDWYGGEPLLNLEFLEAASGELQAYSDREGVSYVASIISNGSLWPSDAEAFVARNRIRQVQISFDGLQGNHDKRRRYRRGHGAENSSSFVEAVKLVDKLVNCVRVDLRLNIDRANSDDLRPFIHFARDRGWFDAVFPAVFQPARLASYSESSAFMRKYELSLEEFDDLRAIARDEIGASARIEESEVPEGFPHPKTSVCAALASNSLVVGAEGLTYRCGLQAGETKRAVGTLEDRGQGAVPGHDRVWWDAFDPTRAPSCSKCSFLPICWGGCPKKHLEGDTHAIQEQGRYWRNNLPRLIAHAAGMEIDRDTVVPEALQFR